MRMLTAMQECHDPGPPIQGDRRFHCIFMYLNAKKLTFFSHVLLFLLFIVSLWAAVAFLSAISHVASCPIQFWDYSCSLRSKMFIYSVFWFHPCGWFSKRGSQLVFLRSSKLHSNLMSLMDGCVRRQDFLEYSTIFLLLYF